MRPPRQSSLRQERATGNQPKMDMPPPGDLVKIILIISLVSTIAIGVMINIIPEPGLRFVAIFLVLGTLFAFTSLHASRYKVKPINQKMLQDPMFYVKISFPLGIAIVGTFMPTLESLVLMYDGLPYAKIVDLVTQAIVYSSILVVLVISLNLILKEPISMRKEALRKQKALEKKGEMSTGQYITYRLLLVSTIHVLAMVFITNFVDDMLTRFLLLLANSFANFGLVSLLKYKAGMEVIKEPRDLSRKIIRTMLRATMPFVIAFLGTFILYGADITRIINNEVYLSIIVLVVQGLVFAFVYVAFYFVSYVFTTD